MHAVAFEQQHALTAQETTLRRSQRDKIITFKMNKQ